MKSEKKAILNKNGWKVGTTSEFLKTSPEEAAYLEIRIAFAELIKSLRKKNHLRQADLAKRLHTSQSRVAKIESADPTVSLDLMAKSAFSMGATTKEIANAIRAA